MKDKLIKYKIGKPSNLNINIINYLIENSVNSLSYEEKIDFINKKIRLNVIIMPEVYFDISQEMIKSIFVRECTPDRDDYKIVIINILNFFIFDIDGEVKIAYDNEIEFIKMGAIHYKTS